MNILFYFYKPIIPHIGGVQRVTDNLTKEFVSRGHSVWFLCSENVGRENDYSFITAPQYYIDFQELGIENNIQALIHKHNINVVINQFDPSHLEDSLLLLRSVPNNVKKISCCHNEPFIFYKKERAILKSLRPSRLKNKITRCLYLTFPFIYRYKYILYYRKIFNLIISNSDRLCLLSSRFFVDFKKLMGSIDDNKICAINNPNSFAIDSDLESDICKENLIVYVGRLENSQKMPYEFLKVWSTVSKNNSTWKAIVIGDGSELQNMRNVVAKNHIRNICFAGNLPDVKSYLNRARIICLTSSSEGWGMVLTEAMAQQCVPVAYGSYASVYDIIDDNICGYVTKPFSPCDMVEKIQTLIDNPDKLSEFAEKAKIKVEMFTASKIVNHWENLFNTIK